MVQAPGSLSSTGVPLPSVPPFARRLFIEFLEGYLGIEGLFIGFQSTFPDIRDLDSLLTQLWKRHRGFYCAMVVLSASGLFGIACLQERLP